MGEGEGEVEVGGERECEETYPIPPRSPSTTKVRIPMGFRGCGRAAGADLQAQFWSAAPHTLCARNSIYADSHFSIELHPWA